MLSWVVGRVAWVPSHFCADKVWGSKCAVLYACHGLESAATHVSETEEWNSSEKPLLFVNLIVPQTNAAYAC